MFVIKGPGFDDRSGRSSGQHSRGPGCTVQVSQLLELYHEAPGIIQGAISEKKNSLSLISKFIAEQQ